MLTTLYNASSCPTMFTVARAIRASKDVVLLELQPTEQPSKDSIIGTLIGMFGSIYLRANVNDFTIENNPIGKSEILDIADFNHIIVDKTIEYEGSNNYGQQIKGVILRVK